MACDSCGAQTTRSRNCRDCAILERAEETARRGRLELAAGECPACGGPTSGEGVVCAECRVGAEAGGDDAD